MQWPPLAPLPLQHTACLKGVARLIGPSFAGDCGRVLATHRARQSVGPLPHLLHADWIESVRGRYRFRRRRASWEDGSGLVLRSDPRGGELRKSRRNRGDSPRPFHGDEADVFVNYALPLHLDCDSLLLPFPACIGQRTTVRRSVQDPVRRGMQRFPDLALRQCRRWAFKGNRIVDTWTMPRERQRHD
jgi:hypothetical protein